ncbi:hypothetical protein Syn7502_03419 [Synechococcus sp. PCC 7502]|uniref:hypothetical protein n=1 Tax=Synechococcus sp. PCC 7502 TaxID=1173263 RepID=UPI00029FE076|nr:hypothetical protein [Synechococcus sp. PCC 7502]AFY75269.1 hypothetical protein Syn7502_03419 [Synechococcus sp. PCC 7502]
MKEVAKFVDNWSYLKAELAWLDRVIMRTIAKQRQLNKEIDRISRNEVDKATSHWWKGFITLDPPNGGTQAIYRPVAGVCASRYGDRIAASMEESVNLTIPILCDRLKLGKFERDLLVLCLAPEINRRYEKLYVVLNNDESSCRQPTIDLALRLFSRSDAEWRAARAVFSPKAPLVKTKILEICPPHTSSQTLIARSIRLSDRSVDYLLSEDQAVESILPKPRKRISAKPPEP